ncbi:hypothetical protein RQCS_62000 (plasmid) [Rhodococcus qingshengii]|nr:hypothetical protein RQCS_62000 [Rhodococcus qingshengii]
MHFTRGGSNEEAKANLLSILDDEEIKAVSDFGMAKPFWEDELTDEIKKQLRSEGFSQKVACFTETPLEHCGMIVKDIQGRSCKFTSFGVVFDKNIARKKGVNPVWYLNTDTSGHFLTHSVDAMVKSCTDYVQKNEKIGDVPRFQALRLTPFLEQTDKITKDFSWEREWRCQGGFVFRPDEVAAVFAPEHEHDDLRVRIAGLGAREWEKLEVLILDPSWTPAELKKLVPRT